METNAAKGSGCKEDGHEVLKLDFDAIEEVMQSIRPQDKAYGNTEEERKVLETMEYLIEKREKRPNHKEVALCLNQLGHRTRGGKPWNNHTVGQVWNKHKNRREAK